MFCPFIETSYRTIVEKVSFSLFLHRKHSEKFEKTPDIMTQNLRTSFFKKKMIHVRYRTVPYRISDTVTSFYFIKKK